MERLWKQLTAYIYATICLFDFMIMPAFVAATNKSFLTSIVAEIKPDDRKYALDIIDRVNLHSWEPVTLYNGGMIFHISFATILTGAGLSNKLSLSTGASGVTVTSTPVGRKEDDTDEKSESKKQDK